MLNHAPTSNENLNSVNTIQNFRIFTSDESGSNYGAPVIKAELGQQPIVYVLVSIMNSLFIHDTSLQHMLRETIKAYNDPNVPIIFVCGDTLQNITKEILFGQLEKDPVEKNRARWQKKFEQGMAVIKAEEIITPNYEIIYWDTFKSVSTYTKIKKFTDAILQHELTLDLLRKSFDTVEVKDEVLNNLFKDVQKNKILENVFDIASEFSSKNLLKLKKKHQSQENKFEKFKKEFGFLVASLEQLEKDFDLQECTNNLKLATYAYLSEEYAVLMLLACLRQTSEIKASLNLASINTEKNDSLGPLLSYPISSSKGKGAALTFRTFQALELLYQKYCVSLNLPILTQRATFIDSLVPDSIYSQMNSDSSSEGSDEDQNLKEKLAVDLSIIEEKKETNFIESQKEGNYLDQLGKIYSSSNSLPTFEFSCEKPISDADNVILKILEKVELHLELKSSITTKTLYKNGINCQITSSSQLKNGAQVADKSVIVMLIKSAVSNVENLIVGEDMTIFNYNGHHIELAVKLTMPRPLASVASQDCR